MDWILIMYIVLGQEENESLIIFVIDVCICIKGIHDAYLSLTYRQ